MELGVETSVSEVGVSLAKECATSGGVEADDVAGATCKVPKEGTEPRGKE